MSGFLIVNGYIRSFSLIVFAIALSACGGGGGGGDGNPAGSPGNPCTSSGNTVCAPSNNTFSLDSDEVIPISFTLQTAGVVTIYTSGNLDMEIDYLRDGNGNDVSPSNYEYFDDVSGTDYNFRAEVTLAAGTYTLGIYEWEGFSGSFTLHVEFEATGGGNTGGIDTIPPDTSISDSPAALENSSSATFVFNSTESGSTFQCSLNNQSFSNCVSPKVYSGLADGDHLFRVKAIDQAGNEDDSPSEHRWTIDTTPPVTNISSGPSSPTNTGIASFTFSASGASSYQCSLNDGVFSSCVSPKEYSGLLEGMHVFRVQAADAAGNVEVVPKSFNWAVDLTPPVTSLTDTPDDVTNDTDASFSFSSSEASTFECSLDGAEFSSCVSPAEYSGLTEGEHSFRVLAIDAAGNVELTPQEFNWIVDLTLPTGSVLINDGAVSTDSTIVNLSLDASDSLAGVDGYCVVDNLSGVTPEKPTLDDSCFVEVSPKQINYSQDVSYTFTNTYGSGETVVVYVWYRDAAGNVADVVVDTIELLILQDTTPPNVASVRLEGGATYTMLNDRVHAALNITDNVGVVGYFITDHNATDPINVAPPVLDPMISDLNWVSVESVEDFSAVVEHKYSQSYSRGDTVRICVWGIDASDNISDAVCDDVRYQVDWEAGWGRWSADNGVWGVGTPTAGPSACYSGSQCAGTELSGNYGAFTDSRLIGATVVSCGKGL